MTRCTMLGAAKAVLTSLPIVCLPSTASARTEFLIQPYLQHVTTRTAQVRFLTDEPVASMVEVRGAGKTLHFREPSANDFHDMMLDGLDPATTYTTSGDLCGYLGDRGPCRAFAGCPPSLS